MVARHTVIFVLLNCTIAFMAVHAGPKRKSESLKPSKTVAEPDGKKEAAAVNSADPAFIERAARKLGGYSKSGYGHGTSQIDCRPHCDIYINSTRAGWGGGPGWGGGGGWSGGPGGGGGGWQGGPGGGGGGGWHGGPWGTGGWQGGGGGMGGWGKPPGWGWQGKPGGGWQGDEPPPPAPTPGTGTPAPSDFVQNTIYRCAQSPADSKNRQNENEWTLKCANKDAYCKFCRDSGTTDESIGLRWCIVDEKDVGAYNKCCTGSSSSWNASSLQVTGLTIFFIKHCDPIENWIT